MKKISVWSCEPQSKTHTDRQHLTALSQIIPLYTVDKNGIVGMLLFGKETLKNKENPQLHD